MADRVWSLQSFLRLLERRLEEMSVQEIRRTLLLHAQGLPGADRDAFFAIFTSTDRTDQSDRMERPPDIEWPVDHDPLLDEIDAFVAGVAAGDYFEGFGWDPEVRDQRSFGDESWVWEFDDYFSQAQDAFLAGRLSLARAAYRRLFDAFELDEEVGTFCGPEPAPDMVQVDLPEAQARYLRAVYETTTADDRAAVLAEEWFDLLHLGAGAEVSLAAVRESRRQDLPQLERFLPAWITQLRSSGREGPQVRKLLTEATELHGGFDGLADLARRGGPDRADLYLDWVRALRSAGRRTDAKNAAHEALDALKGDGSAWAHIAEELADLTRGDAAQVTAARRLAWRASPSQARLLALHRAATHATEARELMAKELAALEASGTLGTLNGGLRAALMLLAGWTEGAAKLLDEPTDHSAGRPARHVLVPYLLASGCAGPQHPEWPSMRLAGLLATVDNANLWGWWTGVDLPDRDRSSDDDTPSLAGLLVEQIRTETDDEQMLWKRLDAALRDVDRLVDAIVSGKVRGQYARAARLLTCCAEALTVADGADAGTALVGRWRARYPRHSAFQRELDGAIGKASLVLTAPSTDP